MILYQELQYSTPAPCPYLPEETFTQAYFFADQLDKDELDLLLETGWRKFGYFYFRPVCVTCRKCIPVRIPVNSFTPSRSQRRLLQKNRSTTVKFENLEYSDILFEMYTEHSKDRFGKDVDSEEFKLSLCTASCPSILSKYFVNGSLCGAGFLDYASHALSSVYFMFKTCAGPLGLGNFSVLREIQHAASSGLLYYYLGYYVEGCTRMEYKSRFLPCERYDWQTQQWETVQTWI